MRFPLLADGFRFHGGRGLLNRLRVGRVGISHVAYGVPFPLMATRREPGVRRRNGRALLHQLQTVRSDRVAGF